MPTSARSISTSKAPPSNVHTVGARMARPEPGAIYEGPVADAPGSGRIYNPPLRCGCRCVRSADCPGPGGWRADVGIGPYEAEPSNPGGNRESVRAAIQAAPTRKPGV